MLRFALLVLFCFGTAAEAQSEFDEQRAQLIAAIEQNVRDTASYIDKRRLDGAVMDAMASVPRHEFVPDDLRTLAYLNRPLPIGDGQTISQPYIVALMTDLAAVNDGSKVLEIGTGSGYQAAVLAEIVSHVYTIEIVEPLGRRAAATLDRLGYDNVTVRIGDGYAGWPEFAPFDAIVVTAAPDHVPEPLVEQLAVGGHLVIPVGNFDQQLMLITRTEDGITRKSLMGVRFVPLRGEAER